MQSHLSEREEVLSAAWRGRRLDPEFIPEPFAQCGPVTVRRMFSGAGIFCDGLMFGLIIRDVIYLKVDETNAAEFEREGSTPFTYTRGRKSGRPSQHALPYWRLPERLYDDPDELAVWARRAFAVAESRKFAERKPTKQTKTKRKKPHPARPRRACPGGPCRDAGNKKI